MTPASTRRCSASVLLPCLLINLLKYGACRSEAKVTSSLEFYQALKDTAVSHIVVMNDMRLNAKDFSELLQIDRDTLIESSGSSEEEYYRVDFDFLQVRCILSKGVTMEFRHLNLQNTRYGPSYNLDFFGYSPGSVVFLNDSMKEQPSCAPPDVDLIKTFPPAPGYPDDINTGVYLMDQYCLRGVCWKQVLMYETYALPGRLGGVDGSWNQGGYVIYKKNSLKTCKSFVTQACIEWNSVDACVINAINEYLEDQDVAEALLLNPPSVVNMVPDEGGSSDKTVAIIVGSVVGGVVLLAIVGAAVWFFVKRKRAAASYLGRSSCASNSPYPFSEQGTQQEGEFQASKMQKSLNEEGMEQGTGESYAYDSNENLKMRYLASEEGDNDKGGLCPPRGRMKKIYGYDDRGSKFFIEVSQIMLGSGSFGKVWLGRWNGQEVAVKQMEHSPLVSDRVAEEVMMMLKFKHDNVVSALQYVNFSLVQRYKRIHKPGLGSVNLADRNLLESGTVQGTSTSSNADVLNTLASFQAASTMGSSTHVAETSQLGPSTHTSPQGGKGCRVDSLDQSTRTPEEENSCSTWIVLELCDQGTLASGIMHGMFHEGGKPLVLPILARLQEVAAGCTYVHQQGICHGDLKCSNILLATDKEGNLGVRAKVADFGLSRELQADNTHLSTRTIGTVSHMAPELLRQGKLTQAGDVYAFGICAWELMCGKPAYKGLLHGQIVERVVVSKKMPSWPAWVPEAYKQLVESCWSYEAVDRPVFPEVQVRVAELLAETNSMQQYVNEKYSGKAGSREESRSPAELCY